MSNPHSDIRDPMTLKSSQVAATSNTHSGGSSDISLKTQGSSMARLARSVELLVNRLRGAVQIDSPPTVIAELIECARMHIEMLRIVDQVKAILNDKDVSLDSQKARLSLAYRRIADLNAQQAQNSNRQLLSSGQRTFGVAFQNVATGGDFDARWYKPLSGLVSVSSLSDSFPEPLAYLETSPSSLANARQLSLKLSQAETRLRDGEISSRRPASQTGPTRREIEKEVQNIRSEILTVLKETKDFNLFRVKGLMNELQVDVIPADQLVAATGTLLTGLATSVASILSSDHASSSSSIEVSSLFVDTDGRLALRGRRVDIDTAERVGEAQNRFPELLQLYLDLRDTSLRLFDSLQGQGSGEAEMGQGFSELRWSLRSVFPGPFANTIKAIQALDALPSPQVGALTARLLTSQILPSSTDGTTTPIYILNQREGMELVFVLARTLIFNSAVFDEKLLANLRESTLASVLEQCEKIRTLLENKNYRQLATFIDDSLDKYIDKPDSNQTSKIALIAAMTALVKDPTCSRALKAQLKKIDRLPELCYNLVENLGKVSTPLSRLIEESRALISKNLSHNLDDYLGQKAIKERLKSTLEKNLNILDRLDKFPNVPPKMAIINGFLLLGLPGGGKTYLVKCLANHFGLPLIKISREEMIKALKVVDEASQKSQSFGGFLQEKIAEVRKQMKFTKARSGLIFFDEMDSNFLKRDPAMSSQAELEETNQMLRILESVMEKNPDLLFMAATNNPHIVDPAARRVGRFGIHIELKATTKEDADELIRGACELLDISFNAIDKATSYQNLLQSCCGMVPYSLHNAVINAYISCEDPPKDGEGLVKLFLSSIESMKIYTTFDGNQKDGAGAS